VAQTHKKARLTQAERTARSDDRLFEASVNLIASKGPQRATLSEIGTLAGYSRGLAAYRYGTKDVFYSALIAYLHDSWVAELEQAVADTSGADSIIAAVTALQQFFRNEPDQLRALFKLYYYSIDHESVTTLKLQEIQASQRREAARWFRECDAFDPAEHSPENFAEQYSALVFGAIYQWLVDPERIDLYDLLDCCKSSLLQLLPKPQNTRTGEKKS